MRRTRAAYHYAIRYVKRNDDSIISEKVAQAKLNNNARDFWSEVKRIRSHRSGSSRTVDGQTDPSSIADVFDKNYRELYSSVPYDFNEMQRINENINCLLSSEQMSSDYIYSCNDVKDAVSQFKAHKSDGHSGLSSDHIINASDLYFTNLALLFSSIVIHGKVPDSYLLSTVVPIPVGNNVNKSDSSQYRGIALSSVYGKIFDNIVLSRYSKILASSEFKVRV